MNTNSTSVDPTQEQASCAKSATANGAVTCNNYERLVLRTQNEQAEMLRTPLLGQVAIGNFDLPTYHRFLTNAYHHVRQTVPLMLRTGASIGSNRHGVLAALNEYAREELGHEQWVLSDLRAAGGDVDRIDATPAAMEVEVLVAYVRDYIEHVHPIGMLGMVHVLEGTSTQLATTTAAIIQHHLHLPDTAFSYLRSHGDLDIGHVDHFKALLELLTDEEMEHVIHVARRVYRLYGAVLQSAATTSATAPAARIPDAA